MFNTSVYNARLFLAVGSNVNVRFTNHLKQVQNYM